MDLFDPQVYIYKEVRIYIFQHRYLIVDPSEPLGSIIVHVLDDGPYGWALILVIKSNFNFHNFLKKTIPNVTKNIFGQIML